MPRLGHQSILHIQPFTPEPELDNGLKVLVVDDESGVCRMLCRRLQNFGYTCLPLVRGAEVLAAIKRYGPDILLIDVNLGGGVNGFDLLRRLKRQDSTRDLPAIMISGDLTSPEDEDLAARLGAVSYLFKPASGASLKAALDLARKAITARTKIAGKVVVVDDDPEWLDLVETGLAAAGHAVVARRDASGLIAVLRQERPDCVILDFALRPQPADALCREIRSQPELNQAQIICHTFHPDAKLAVIKAGADHFVAKDSRLEELLEIVQACLRRKRWDARGLTRGGLQLEGDGFRVIWNGRTTGLTAEQFDFLYVLVCRANSWIKTEVLMSEMRHREALSERALIQLASRLRKLLPERLGQRLRYSRKSGWIYQTDSIAACEPR